jgi:hypothetical protein
MTTSDDLERWRQQSEAAFVAVTAWRNAHPTATLTEIETALDGELNRVRAHVLQDVASASAATQWVHTDGTEQPRCPQCGRPLQARGKHTRQLRTQGNESITLERTYGVCPVCTTGFFPPR